MADSSNKININPTESTFRYSNETFSGCDMTASITMNTNRYNEETKKWEITPYTKIVGELTTVSYSIHMEKKPIRSIGNVNAKDYVMGQRTIAGSLVFSVFNKHFAEDLIRNLNTGYDAGTAFLVDELPPFDLTISAANEYGFRSRLAIYGIRLLNEGQVMSINDVYTENTYQFFATDLEYLNSEMAYTRDKDNNMYKLKDIDIETNKYVDKRLIHDYKLWTEKQQDNYNNIMDRPIKLLSSVKQPTRKDAKGIVTFIVDPTQDEGIITVVNSNNESTYMTLPVVDKKTRRSMSIDLPADSYTASFQNTRSKKISNTVRFSINSVFIKNNLKKYAPIIERVTDTSLYVYANEPSHNKIKISWEGSSDTATNEYKLVNRRCILKDLTPGTSYTVFTLNDTDKIPSVSVSVSTLGIKDKLFEELILFCYANSRHLVFADMKVYNKLIEEAKLVAINLNLGVNDSLLNIKRKYMTLLSSLSNDIVNNDLRDEYNLNIKACNEIIILAIRLANDFIEAVNLKDSIESPTMKLNSRYENVFTFNEKTTSAEFYKDYGNVIQFYYEVPKYNFKNINGVENSFRFNGKPGTKHFVEALKANVRSPKLEFYVMTQIEKNEFIKKDELSNKLTDRNIDEINTQIKKDEIVVTETPEYKRAFMIAAKRIDNALLFPPEIETINENVLLRTTINSIIHESFSNEFFLAIANYEDILCDSPIYKIKFTNRENVIAITQLLNGLKTNVEYAIWIEDASNKQLSNASTFIYSETFSLEDDEMKSYELKDISSKIELIAKSTLPSDVCDDVLAVIQNNRTVTNYSFIEEVLAIITTNTINKNVLIKFLKEFKYFLGIMKASDPTILSNIEYSNELCKFDTSIKGTLLMYNITPGECVVYPTIIEDNNLINTTIYQDIVLLIAVDDKLNKKSDLILINKKEKYMEVL